ncbi:GGDEF domain-containing protein [Gallaecimonas kandeliae]|uniref:GGDEF domain-containing protein n=1 Tax=Gallaecimonas kandeliae TaxID=3029055 RepID=UPI002649D925|nr:GGDEF domain-containing protein [Gallaecimonas kandeliae]WKE64510.1 GGDEF domain-containing protein [Gallaecimonas kandeliae]
MQFRPYLASSAAPVPALSPRPEDVVNLHQSLDPQQVLMRFAALAKHCLPLAGVEVDDSLRLRLRSGIQERFLPSQHPLLSGISYHFASPLSLWQEQLLAHWHDALEPALGNALLHRQALAMARTDHLTGLGNRAAFAEEGQRLVATGERHKHLFCLMLLDLDHFKPVNDTFGHQRGDAILYRVGQLLRAQARQEDRCFRMGGDEFALLLPDTYEEGGQVLAERLLTALAEDDYLHSHGIGFSLGLAQWQPGEHIKSLEARADMALYQAKDAGRGCLKSA